MRKLITAALIAFSLLSEPVFCDNDPYPDWDWINGHWVWVGTGDPGDPPPPIKG